jgi:hypothetical protein
VFSASEDLGNGMTAFAKVMLDSDSQTGASKDEIVGLKGSFGTVFAGRFEAFVEGNVASTMTMNGNAAIEQSTANAERTSQGIAYVSPTMNGLHIGVGGYASGTGSESEDFDAKEVAVFYANGPIDVKIARQTLNNTLASTSFSETTTAIALAYTMGDAKVSYLRMANDDFNGTNDSVDNSYRLDYTMGANKITVAHLDDETTSGASGADVTALELTHSFSKRTQAYVGMTDSDTASTDTTYFGLQHSF